MAALRPLQLKKQISALVSSANIIAPSGPELPAYRWCGFRREACNGVSVLRAPLGAGAVMPRLYGIFRRVLYRVENFLLRLADRVSTIAPAMGRRAVEKGATSQRTWLAPNCADIRAIAPGPRDNAVRRELGFDAGHLLVLRAVWAPSRAWVSSARRGRVQ
ncbi:MAG: hypothetical protein HYX64_03470 [Gammaproteobacteria bacterium]|nr:hypothetical protein [Gammaproteobacteria bacterium]